MVRAGFIARGITYGTMGGLALALAFGGGRTTAPNQQGALATVASAPLGRLAVAVIAVGLLAYALWKLAQCVQGRGPEGGGGPKLTDRLANLGGGIVYLLFCAVAIKVLTGSSGSGSSEPRHAAAGLLGWPGGEAIVGAAGVGLIAISLYQTYDALTGRFTDECKVESMGDRELHVFLAIGVIGLTARALVFGLVGYFLLITAVDSSAANTVGVDGALEHVRQQPYGQALLAIAASGLLIFAVFSLLEARYRRL